MQNSRQNKDRVKLERLWSAVNADYKCRKENACWSNKYVWCHNTLFDKSSSIIESEDLFIKVPNARQIAIMSIIIKSESTIDMKEAVLANIWHLAEKQQKELNVFLYKFIITKLKNR